MRAPIIIGAGHNGLIAAIYLARAGLTPLVLERRGEVGGGAVTGEIHPGFLCPTLSHETLLHAEITRDLALPGRGVQFLRADVQVWASSADGAPLILYDDARRTAEGLIRVSRKDAEAYTAYRGAMEGVASVLASVLTSPPPRIDDPTARDAWRLLQVGRRFRALERRDRYRLLRWLPMPAADLVDEWFESDLLRAAIAGRSLSGTMLGPRSAGGALVLLMREAHQLGAGSTVQRVRGGPGALTRALAAAATEAGAEIRTDARVERILVQDDAVTGVVAQGQEIRASSVISAVDPKTTFLALMDPADLPPEFLTKTRNYRSAGTVAKVNLALSRLPAFDDATDERVLSGRIHLGPDLDYLERAFDRAKYGELPSEPWLDVTFPSILDPDLAPRGAHVASIYVHYAPYALRHADWDTSAAALLEATMRVLDRHAPGTSAAVVGAQAITPRQLEREYGLAGGHIFHGELALDQLFTMRPLLGYARYDSPIRGLHLCGAGTHPGGFLTGLSGRLAAAEVLKGGKRP